ncbi:MAG: M6 family metalloprotease domain-containing protein [bacterium]
MRKKSISIILALAAFFLFVIQTSSSAFTPVRPDDVPKLKETGELDSMMKQWFDYIEKNPTKNYSPEDLIQIPQKIEQIQEMLISDSPVFKSDIDLDANGVIDERDFLELGYPAERQAQAYWEAPSIGEQKTIVILVDFDDRPGDPQHGSGYFYDLIFSENKLPNPSMRDYYLENSHDLLDVVGTVADSGVNGGWFRIHEPSSNYYGFDNAPYLVNKAIDLADPLIDFSQFDNGNNGEVESLMVVVSGERSGSTFWPHKWNLYEARQVDDVWVYPYFLSTEDSKMGIFAHEHGHAMGLPDLYDYDYDTWGVGDWCIMGFGCYGGGGAVPVHMSAWCKYQLGWVDVVNVTDDLTRAELVGTPVMDSVYRLWSNGQSGAQYFLIENRRKLGYDAYLPGEGVLIWHIDHYGDQRNQNHRLVDLEEADGLDDIDTMENKGDTGDPYYLESGINRFTDFTYPNAHKYNGSTSGIKITSVSEQGEIMYAALSNNPFGIEEVEPIEPGSAEPVP